MAAPVPQHLHGLLDPAPAGRLTLGLGHPLRVLALVGEGQPVEGRPGLGVGGQGGGQVGGWLDGTGARALPKTAGTSRGTSKNTPLSSVRRTVSKRWVAMGRC